SLVLAIPLSAIAAYNAHLPGLLVTWAGGNPVLLGIQNVTVRVISAFAEDLGVLLPYGQDGGNLLQHHCFVGGG
ncbi:hypothetical protein ACLMMR_38665, partial [Streptomyces sp. NPDC000405]